MNDPTHVPFVKLQTVLNGVSPLVWRLSLLERHAQRLRALADPGAKGAASGEFLFIKKTKPKQYTSTTSISVE